MQTRRFIAVAGALLALAVHASFADSKSAESESERFYGTVAKVDAGHNSLTVHNKKKNKDATFQMGDDTQITKNKQSITPHELKVGEFLVVYYVSENDVSHAQRISVRPPPFKKE